MSANITSPQLRQKLDLLFQNITTLTKDSIAFKDMTFEDVSLQDLTATGNVAIGNAVTDTVGFYGVTKVAQPADADQAAAGAQTQNTLTDNGAGTADQTVEDVADIALSTGDTYTDAAVNGAVNTAIASVSNNFKEVTTELALIEADVAAIKTLQDAMRTALVSLGIIKGAA